MISLGFHTLRARTTDRLGITRQLVLDLVGCRPRIPRFSRIYVGVKSSRLFRHLWPGDLLEVGVFLGVESHSVFCTLSPLMILTEVHVSGGHTKFVLEVREDALGVGREGFGRLHLVSVFQVAN